MKIFNSYSNALETFTPHHPKKVSIYVCGPTVYNYIHIGNARPVVVFDTVRRYFEAEGYNVKFASNFTDVDDKIIQRAKDEGVSESVVSEKYIQAFLSDLTALNCKTDYIKPKVTEYMDKIIDYIQELVKIGYAYVIDGDVYFRVGKLAEYGRLSNRKIEDLISGARVEINEKKESPLDFTLWKKTEEGLHWHTAFSDGRPGWHTECVAMIDDIFGEEIDIHGGGTDLMFPHHENEIAQSVAKNHHHVARYWMHNGRLNFDGEKMSKSLGNDIKVKDLHIDKLAYRMFLLSSHYRSPLNYSPEALDVFVKEWQKTQKSVESLHRLLDLRNELKESVIVEAPDIVEAVKYYNDSMSNDFNTPNALTAISQLMRAINQKMRQSPDFAWFNQALVAVKRMLDILGLEVPLTRLLEEDKATLRRWEAARVAKDFALADELRIILANKGLFVSILLNGSALAYIGDAIYEVEIRKYLLTKNMTKVNDLHQAAIRFTSAVGQCKIMESFLKSGLTETEIEYFKRGRNAESTRKARNTDLGTYHQATGFEALLGYLYLDNQPERLAEIIQRSIQLIEEPLAE